MKEEFSKNEKEIIDILKAQAERIPARKEHLEQILESMPERVYDKPILSPFSGVFFRKYGFILTAGITLALVAVISTKPTTPVPELTWNDVKSVEAPAEMGFKLSAPTGASTEAMEHILTEGETIDYAVLGISESVMAEAGKQETAARDAELASYDKEDIKSLSANK